MSRLVEVVGEHGDEVQVSVSVCESYDGGLWRHGAGEPLCVFFFANEVRIFHFISLQANSTLKQADIFYLRAKK